MTGCRERDARPPPGALRARRPFPREVLSGPSLEAARALLGARLVRDTAPGDGASGPRVGRIVEVEAYIGLEDRASHARMGPTARNAVMFGPPGIAYVYLVYGMHHCLNVVTEPAPRPAALLIRAVEPLERPAAMRVARDAARSGRGRTGPAPHVADARLAAGPGLVAAAFSIGRSDTGLDLCDPRSPLRLETRPPGESAPVVEATPRVGITYAGEPWASLPWRFIATGSPSLSRHRA
jgi:DNA-3-methyladenine glycosylase